MIRDCEKRSLAPKEVFNESIFLKKVFYHGTMPGYAAPVAMYCCVWFFRERLKKFILSAVKSEWDHLTNLESNRKYSISCGRRQLGGIYFIFDYKLSLCCFSLVHTARFISANNDDAEEMRLPTLRNELEVDIGCSFLGKTHVANTIMEWWWDGFRAVAI